MVTRQYRFARTALLTLFCLASTALADDPPPTPFSIPLIDLAAEHERQVVVDRQKGQYRVRLMDNHKGADGAYPGVDVLRDGTFVTTTYGHWTQGQSPYLL